MSHCIAAVKDANPKISSAALCALSVLIRKYRDDFLPLTNMSFETLLLKLGDAKVEFMYWDMLHGMVSALFVFFRQVCASRRWVLYFILSKYWGWPRHSNA
jgi:hypothetical protein